MCSEVASLGYCRPHQAMRVYKQQTGFLGSAFVQHVYTTFIAIETQPEST